jgi:hypothetical protein
MANRFAELGGKILLLATAVVSVALALLHIFGVLNIPWVSERIPEFILITTGLIAGYLAFETTGKLEKIETQIAAALGSSEVKRFDTIEDVSAHVRALMERAYQIDDLTWGPPILHQGIAHKTAYTEYRKQVIELGSKPNLRYREVMTFPDLDRVSLAEEMFNWSLPAYQIKYYDTQPGMPPLMRFILIDDEAIFVHHREPGLPEEGAVWVSVRDPYVLQMLKVYYAEVWKEAKPLDKMLLDSFRSQLTGAPNTPKTEPKNSLDLSGGSVPHN